jgi:uncharacterized protein with HEPN domain
MARDPAAYLVDALEACQAIEEVISDVDLEAYRSKRSIRSSVEREFILIGEALRRLESVSPKLFSRIAGARLAIDFRNLLAHNYSAVDDDVVFGVAHSDLSILKRDLEALLLVDEGSTP